VGALHQSARALEKSQEKRALAELRRPALSDLRFVVVYKSNPVLVVTKDEKNGLVFGQHASLFTLEEATILCAKEQTDGKDFSVLEYHEWMRLAMKEKL
jgi:hypothetical protein